MKVILLQDVARIGRRGSIVVVPDGFAQNKLIPKRLAEPATPVNLKKAQKAQVDVANAADNQAQKFAAAAALLQEGKVTIKADANQQSHLFKAIHESDIAAAAKEIGIDVEAGMIVIPIQIKSLGTHEVELVHKGQKEKFTIEVVSK